MIVKCYEIIADENLLKDFISWLPDLKEGECYYFSLQAKKKYCELLNRVESDRQQVYRFICNSKDDILGKIQRLEVPWGIYTRRDVKIPNEALALYVTINPRSHITAGKNMLKLLADKVCEGVYQGFNLHQIALTEIHKAQSRKVFMDFDFDISNDEESLSKVKKQVLSYINSDCVSFMHTRGGMHIIIELSKVDKQYEKTWYKNITSIEGLDSKSNHNLTPVVGCYQGGFIPYFDNTLN